MVINTDFRNIHFWNSSLQLCITLESNAIFCILISQVKKWAASSKIILCESWNVKLHYAASNYVASTVLQQLKSIKVLPELQLKLLYRTMINVHIRLAHFYELENNLRLSA